MTKMTQQEKELFLAGLHVGVLAIPDPSHGPLTVPVWYDYKPGGDLWFLTGPTSRKGKLLRQGVRVSLCAQTETPPYKYVSIEGPVTLGEPDPERDVREVAIRYLGQQMGEMYLAMMAADPDAASSVLVTLKPERWYSVDYSKLG